MCAALLLAAAPASVASETYPVEVTCGVGISMFAKPLHAGWMSYVYSETGSSVWSRMLHVQYSPFVVLKNTANRRVVLEGNPTITFKQAPLALKFTRIGEAPQGAITTAPVPLDGMYANSAVRGTKTFGLIAYQTMSGTQGSGSVALNAGETVVLRPYMAESDTITNNLDWTGGLTSQITAIPGWAGCAYGYNAYWLAGDQSTMNPGMNWNMGLIVSREEDAWDVDVALSGATAGWRIFKFPASGQPVFAADTALQITRFPLKMSSLQAPVKASDMLVGLVTPITQWQMRPLVSALGPATSPALKVLDDGDANGLNDIWEMNHFNAMGVNPAADADGDSQTNGFEYLAGTSPVDGNDRFSHRIEIPAVGNPTLVWSSRPGRSYVVEYSDDLAHWSVWSTVIGAASPAVSTACDLGPKDVARRYFRIVLGGS